jgi:hypothetical protein
MEATIVDLRYHMNNVLKALERNEAVNVLYRGRVKGIIQPVTTTSSSKVRDHGFFASCQTTESVESMVERMRGGRYRDL